MKELVITSSAFKKNQQIPKKYACDGENMNPPIKVDDVPKETRSLVLIIDALTHRWAHGITGSSGTSIRMKKSLKTVFPALKA